MQILKFGGTSVANAGNIQKVLEIVHSKVDRSPVVVVVSAMSGITDLLLEAASKASSGDESFREILTAVERRHLDATKQLLPVQLQSHTLSVVKQYCNELEEIGNGIFLLEECSPRTRDRVASFGELLSSQIIAAAFKGSGVDTIWKDSRELIRTDSNFGKATVQFETSHARIRTFFEKDPAPVTVIPGFIASDENNTTTTLGRGGSDYTAAILAASLPVSELEIWTDVSGMMTADPRWVPNAKIIPSISYQEAMELSHFGAKVIYPPTIQPVMSKGVPVWIKNTFAPSDPGTVIESGAKKNGSIIRGISSMSEVALLSLEGSGMVGIPGFSKRLFEALAGAQINVILITQSSSEHSICVGVEEKNSSRAREVVDQAFAHEIGLEKVEPLSVEKSLSIVAVVGENMKSHPGISGKMFGTLGRNGVNVRAIAQGSSERNISAVIGTADVRKAINVLHEEFFETTYKQINLFVAGVGNVGGKLLQQLLQQQNDLAEHLRLQVRVIGLLNSRKMLLNNEGIDLRTWKEKLAESSAADLPFFVQEIIRKNLRNSVFVDVTANDSVANVYEHLLQKSVSVVACNKIASSSSYNHYKELKDLSREYNAHYLFETNVGAGLPVIGTLNDLLRSGDSVNRIEAVLSGTLNFVFNHYDGTRSFAEVVKQAQDEGYTEPDPRLDLSGTDVMRKILILAREAGEKLEMEDISNEGFLPASCMEGDVDAFYRELAHHEPHFKKLYDQAASSGKKLKFVASYENNHATVGLQEVDPQHDFYNLYGKDNIVRFYTVRYPEQPLVVKGAGAGADVTASGVFADIIRAAKM